MTRTLQADTERRRRVLSVFLIGKRLLDQHFETARAALTLALNNIRYTIAAKTLETA
jgi:hypothetical protein